MATSVPSVAHPVSDEAWSLLLGGVASEHARHKIRATIERTLRLVVEWSRVEAEYAEIDERIRALDTTMRGHAYASPERLAAEARFYRLAAEADRLERYRDRLEHQMGWDR